jgi:hypothetical protein
VNDPVNGAVSEVNWVDDEMVFAGSDATTWVELDTVPVGSNGVICVDDETIPAGILDNPVYET